MDFTQKKFQWIWLAVYITYLGILTLSPYRFSLERFHELTHFAPKALFFELIYARFNDMFVNLLLFLPFGFLYFYFKGMKIRFWLRAFLTGGLVSLCIEFMQIFVQRSTNGMDIFMNASGSAAGFFLAAFYYRKLARRTNRRGWGVRAFRLAVLIVYTLIVVRLCLLPELVTRADDWKSWYPLVLGNEVTQNRPWAGDLYRAAIYSRALRGDEIRSRYAGGPGLENGLSASSGPVAEYRFDEGGGNTVHDVSGIAPPLDLTGDSIQWIPGGGIRLRKNPVKSSAGAAKITEAVMASNALSVEVWCRPADLTQGGPARIVTVSPDTDRRNFCLAQEGRAIHVRFRSHLGGNNGSHVNLRAGNTLRDTALVHLTATVNKGVQQLYVNGRRHPDVVYGHVSYLPEMLGLAKKMRSLPGQISLLFCLFFPFGVLISAIRGKAAWVATVLFLLIITAGIDLKFVLSAGAPFCLRLYLTGLISGLLGVLVFSQIVRPEAGGPPA